MKRRGPLTALVLSLCAAGAQAQPTTEYVRQLSLDSLLNVEVSTAARHAQKVSQAPASVTVITAEDIRRYGYRRLTDVIQRLRGFYVSSDRNYTYVGARGFSRPTDYNNRVLLLLNGQPMNEGVYGSAAVDTEFGINLASVERIEVVRGPASALYGTSAMLAVINVITMRGATMDGGRLSFETGSAGHVESSLAFGKRLGGTDVQVGATLGRSDGTDVYFPEFDAPETNGGWAEGLDWDRYGSVLAVARRGGVTLQGWYSERRKGVPTASWETRFNGPGLETLDAHGAVALGYERRFGSTRLGLQGYYGAYRYDGSYPGEDWTLTDSTTWSRVGTQAQLVWEPSAAHSTTVGIEAERHQRADYRGWTDGEAYFIGDFPHSKLAVYAQHEAGITPDLTLVAGLRHDRLLASEAPDEATVSPRLGLLYSPTEARTLKLLYGDAFRAPNVYERFYQDESFATNPDLKREHVHTLELIWEERLAPWLRTEVSVFTYLMQDLIDTAEDADGTLRFVNREGVLAPGVELELQARLAHGASAYASYTYQRARSEEGGDVLTNSPAHLPKLGFTADVGARSLVMAEARYEGRRLTIAGSETEPALVARGGVRATLLPRLRGWATVENLFDAAFAVPAGYEHVQVTIPQGGRSFAIGLGYRF